ncbi:SDR family NAD(P)-dependent oxidoreductase [Streptomyces halstedii]|uniref:SDR family NAD(P)-dependent oxidoreductase n=1 Tax=Streptomyces halstedii TaxID=1944 RepID=UPI0037F5675F
MCGRRVVEVPCPLRRVVESNVVGSAVTARVFLPDLLRTRGYCLQRSSLAALAPTPLMSAYCASKSGAESFAQVVRAEVAHRGVGGGRGLPQVGGHGDDPGRRHVGRPERAVRRARPGTGGEARPGGGSVAAGARRRPPVRDRLPPAPPYRPSRRMPPGSRPRPWRPPSSRGERPR